MNLIKKFLVYLFLSVIWVGNANSNSIPGSFADLAEKLMPSVVNISTTQTIKTKSRQLPF